eukprot:m.185005 g.185005  ORF g.185005 m.185005 type:complete len:318 (-) comp10006_c1_seq30:137-1090(-)
MIESHSCTVRENPGLLLRALSYSWLQHHGKKEGPAVPRMSRLARMQNSRARGRDGAPAHHGDRHRLRGVKDEVLQMLAALVAVVARRRLDRAGRAARKVLRAAEYGLEHDNYTRGVGPGVALVAVVERVVRVLGDVDALGVPTEPAVVVMDPAVARDARLQLQALMCDCGRKLRVARVVHIPYRELCRAAARLLHGGLRMGKAGLQLGVLRQHCDFVDQDLDMLPVRVRKAGEEFRMQSSVLQARLHWPQHRRVCCLRSLQLSLEAGLHGRVRGTLCIQNSQRRRVCCFHSLQLSFRNLQLSLEVGLHGRVGAGCLF